MIRVFLGLGSNLVGRKDHLRATLDALSRSPRTELVGISRIYKTRAVGVEEEQPDYLNCVAEVECDPPAVELLRPCQESRWPWGGTGRERGRHARWT